MRFARGSGPERLRALVDALRRGERLRVLVDALRPSERRPCGMRHALALPIALAALLLIPCALPAVEAPDAQRDPALKAVVAKAINEAECFVDRNDSAVWYTLMEPRLRRIVQDQKERMEILRLVYCETQRPQEVRLPPGLVMAMIDVESRFNRYAVSSAGAVGLMQVMPFWPEQLGMRRYELTHIAQNIRMGCAIFRHYLGVEHRDVRKALARYNGSVGRRDYPDLIVTRWTRWNGADDMGLPAAKPVPAAQALPAAQSMPAATAAPAAKPVSAAKPAARAAPHPVVKSEPG